MDSRDDVAAARAETIRYHRALYAGPAPDDGTRGWLARPHRLVVDALTLCLAPARSPAQAPLHAYDLGAGTGRHALLLAEHLPEGSRVTAVDLLPEAIDRLREHAARAGVLDRLELVVADLEAYRFAADDAGLVVAFSAVEHLGSVGAVTDLLARCRRATRPGGVNVVAIFADRREISARGTRDALVECPLTAREAEDLLATAYTGWEILASERSATSVRETREGEDHELRSTLVSMVARAPG